MGYKKQTPEKTRGTEKMTHREKALFPKLDEMSEFELASALAESVFGQEKAMIKIALALKWGGSDHSNDSIRAPNKSLFFVDSDGHKGATGKTHTARELSEILFSREPLLICIPNKFSYGSDKVLTLSGSELDGIEVNRDSGRVVLPPCVVLIDEVDKADLETLRYIEQMLWSDANAPVQIGDEVFGLDLKGTLVILTSSSPIERWDSCQSRFTNITFCPLDKEALVKVAKAHIADLSNQLWTARKIAITAEDCLVEEIVSGCLEREKMPVPASGGDKVVYPGDRMHPVRSMLNILKGKIGRIATSVALKDKSFSGTIALGLEDDGWISVELKPQQNAPPVKKRPVTGAKI